MVSTSERSASGPDTMPAAAAGDTTAGTAAARYYVSLSAVDRIVTRLVMLRRPVVSHLLAVLGVEVPAEVRIGRGLRIRHALGGLVVHRSVTIGRNVTIYQRVTIGRAHVTEPMTPDWPGVTIDDEAVLCAGCVVLGGRDGTTVGHGTVVAANAVLTSSTGEWEIWAGAPARCVGTRSR